MGHRSFHATSEAGNFGLEELKWPKPDLSPTKHLWVNFEHPLEARSFHSTSGPDEFGVEELIHYTEL